MMVLVGTASEILLRIKKAVDDPKSILHYIFQEIIKYKSSNLSWSDSQGHFNRGGAQSDNLSNAATQNGATENSHNSDIPQINAIWSIRFAFHLTSVL